MVQLLPVCCIVRWGVCNLFLFTDWLSGPQQYLIMNTTFCVLDLYFTLYLPCTWVKESMDKNWAGWGRNANTGKHFHFVRKPDPREELLRKGYFQKIGRFAFLKQFSILLRYLHSFLLFSFVLIVVYLAKLSPSSSLAR